MLFSTRGAASLRRRGQLVAAPNERRFPVSTPPVIEGGNPDPLDGAQCRPGFFPGMLAEGLNERIGVKSVEGPGDRGGIQFRNQALALILFDAGRNGLIKVTEKLEPGGLQPLVIGCRVRDRLQNRAL